MQHNKPISALGKRGTLNSGRCSLARWVSRGKAGESASSSSNCLKIGTWNVRGLNQPGKLAGVIQEIEELGLEGLGIAETFWKGEGEFTTSIPTSENRFTVIFSGGDKTLKGVGFIMQERLAKRISFYDLISERILCIKLFGKQHDVLIFQVYAPTEDSDEEEKEVFYESLSGAIKKHKKFMDQLVIMGDFNAKVGYGVYKKIVGEFAIGERNKNGDSLIEFCDANDLFVCNTWYEQKNKHTWISPDGVTKNQIDYILASNRYRNSITNAKVRTSADCGSDHHVVVMNIRLRLKFIKKGKKRKQWNRYKLKDSSIAKQFEDNIDAHLKQHNNRQDENAENTWKQLKESISQVADNICGQAECSRQQPWITVEILQKMAERRRLKNRLDDDSKKQYKMMNKAIRKMCREAKEKHYSTLCKELEDLDRKHSDKLYTKIKEMKPKRMNARMGLVGQDGKMIQNEKEKLKRWKDYVEELYNDNRPNIEIQKDDHAELVEISEMEVRQVINNLSNNKATGVDEIPAEFLKHIGTEGLNRITKLINMIYRSGEIPNDFLVSTFVPIPKVGRAIKCEDHRTISLISHASKILLYVIKSRISPLVEQHLDETQVGFRQGRGTRDGIFLLRTIGERRIEKKEKTYLCYIDYTKAFDRVQHHKLLKIMKDIGIPFYETQLIKNLYFNQKAHVRFGNEVTEDFEVRRGVRQGCILSPVLFNLYSEVIIREALGTIPNHGVKFNGQVVGNIRYADDTVITAEDEEMLQVMMNKVNESCKQYGMLLNAKKTKTMVFKKDTDEVQVRIQIEDEILEQVKEYKYLGTIITEDCRCTKEVKVRIAQAKHEFWNCKEFLRRDINIKLKKKLLDCYIKSVMSYGCEAWTFSKEIIRRINAFQLWCYRRLLKISYMDRVTNEEVMRRVGERRKWSDELAQRKLRFAGHVLRGSGGRLSQLILEGMVDGKRDRGRQRRTWGVDINEWANSKNLGETKRKAEDRVSWRQMVANLRIGEGT